MSGMRPTMRIMQLKVAGLTKVLCHDCYPFAGMGYRYEGTHEYYRAIRGYGSGWRHKDDTALPPAGNGHPSPTGPCRTCDSIGLVAFPIEGVHYESDET